MLYIRNGASVTVTLTALQKKMLPAMTLPLPEECPTGLRYALAKYDADAVAEAWSALRLLADEGMLVEAEN